MIFLNDTNILIIVIVILVIAVIILAISAFRLNAKMKKFLINVDAHNISDSLNHLSTELHSLQKFQKTIEEYLTQTEKRLQRSIGSIHTIRFNPFHGTGEGGNQSFATAFLNENGDGVIISSLYSRDKVSIYSKPIKNFSSEYEMSEEEKEALNKAKEKLKSI